MAAPFWIDPATICAGGYRFFTGVGPSLEKSIELRKGIRMTGLNAIGATAPPNTEKRLRAVSVELEASFLAEMLRTAGLGKTPAAFGGGAGEDQFGSFLVREQARAMAERGGIGLAEAIFNSLKGQQDD